MAVAFLKSLAAMIFDRSVETSRIFFSSSEREVNSIFSPSVSTTQAPDWSIPEEASFCPASAFRSFSILIFSSRTSISPWISSALVKSLLLIADSILFFIVESLISISATVGYFSRRDSRPSRSFCKAEASLKLLEAMASSTRFWRAEMSASSSARDE